MACDAGLLPAVLGGLLWAVGVTTLGYFLGHFRFNTRGQVEVEATSSGILARVLAEVGQILKPGDPLAVIAENDEPRVADRRLILANLFDGLQRAAVALDGLLHGRVEREHLAEQPRHEEEVADAGLHAWKEDYPGAGAVVDAHSVARGGASADGSSVSIPPQRTGDWATLLCADEALLRRCLRASLRWREPTVSTSHVETTARSGCVCSG